MLYFAGTTVRVYNVNLEKNEIEDPFVLHAKKDHTLADLKKAIEEVRNSTQQSS